MVGCGLLALAIPAPQIQQAQGELTMPRVNRRALLVSSGSAVIASTATGTAIAGISQRGNPEPTHELRALIEQHEVAYAAFGKSIGVADGNRHDHENASQAEEKALLAVCSYRAVSEGDRRTKAEYLLEVEARGELDLKEHMQAILRSTMWRG
jgi:hypothetical protein